MSLDEPAAQLHRELRASIQSALKPRRPIIHHLNDDTSWLLQIPRPENAIRRGARIYFNILIDPWFTGGQSDVASWFSQQYHATPSAVQSITELEDLIRGVERLALARSSGNCLEDAGNKNSTETASLIDVVAVSHEFTDHCHHDTLVSVHKDVPVLAFPQAATVISSWKHFRTIIPLSTIDAGKTFDWRSSSIAPCLPEWLGICQLKQTEDRFNYHSAMLITFNNRHGSSRSRLGLQQNVPGKIDANNRLKLHHIAIAPDEDDEAAEALIYTPHGMHSVDFEVIPKAVPSISTVAFLHGLHNVRIGTATGGTALQLNLGSHNGLKAQRVLKAGYWIGTHDEIKKGGGLVSWFLQRESLTIKDALDLERNSRLVGQGNKTNGETADLLNSFDETAFLSLKNGESRILL